MLNILGQSLLAVCDASDATATNVSFFLSFFNLSGPYTGSFPAVFSVPLPGLH